MVSSATAIGPNPPDWLTGSGGVFGTGFRIVPPPLDLQFAYPSDKSALIYIVIDTAVTNRRRTKSAYRIYFAPIDSASPARISDPFVAYNVFSQAQQIASQEAPENGGKVTFPPDPSHVGLDGWFFATAVNLLGVESAPTPPRRNPLVGSNDSRIAPDVLSPSAIVLDGGLDHWGRQLLKVRVSAKVPSQSKGIGTITMENPGQGYPHAFDVIFRNAVGDTTGHGAFAVARVQNGGVLGAEITNAGEGYTLPPIAIFDNGAPGIGAAARVELTETGSFSAFQLYLFNYFMNGIAVEGPTVTAPTFGGKATKPGDLVHGDLILYPDSPPDHIMRLHFVSISQTATRRVDPLNAPFVEFPTGLHL